jgi:hypothetical protein
MADILKLTSEKMFVKKESLPLRVSVAAETNPHKFQLFVDYGATEDGPWVKLGFNDTSYGIGYLPE